MVEHFQELIEELTDFGQEGGEELFDYNRENFFFNQEQNIERQFQEQNMRIEKFNLYREDVRDLMELTTGKMDSYILPILFELNACYYLLVRGNIWSEVSADETALGEEQKEIPMWLIWLYVINLGEAFLYLLTALWLAMHASVSAHSFGVRLLTQFVRLPVPTQAQMKNAYQYASEFEGTGARAMLRVPALHRTAFKYLQGVADRALGAPDDDLVLGNGERYPRSFMTSFASSYETAYHDDTGRGALDLADAMQNLNPVMSLKHVRLYRELQANWQAHDAYARACLSLGTYTFVYSLAYYILALFVVRLNSPFCAAGAVLVLVMLSFLMISLDLYYKTYFFIIGSFSLMMGPAIAAFAIMTEMTSDVGKENWRYIRSRIVPLIFGMQAILCLAMVLIVRGRQVSAGGQSRVALPTRFKTVLYLDVFGWMKDEEDIDSEEEEEYESFGSRIRRQVSQSFTKTGPGLPLFVREALEKECVDHARMVRRELEVWNSGAASKSVKAIPNLADWIARLRLRFDGLDAELQMLREELRREEQAAPGKSDRELEQERRPSIASSTNLFGDDDPTAGMWLRIVWQSDDASVEYFVQASTGEKRSDVMQLPDDALVSDPEQLEERMDALHEQVRALKQAAQGKPVKSPQSNFWTSEDSHVRSTTSSVSNSESNLSRDGNDEESDGLLASRDNTSRQNDSRKSSIRRFLSYMKGEKDEPRQHADDISDTESTYSDAEALHRWASPAMPARSQSVGQLIQMGASGGKLRKHVSLSSCSPEFIEPLSLPGRHDGLSSTEDNLSMPSTGALSRVRFNSTASTFPSRASGSDVRRTWSPSILGTSFQRMSSASMPAPRQRSSRLSRGRTRVIPEEEQEMIANPDTRKTQVLTFGGTEAAPVDRQGQFYRHSETAAQTFHPKRDGRKESKRPPGQVPWLTFLSASGVLALIWLIGMAGIIRVEILYPEEVYKNKRAQSNDSASHEMFAASAETAGALPVGSVVIDAHAWQRRPVPAAPTGLACHEAMAGVVFLAEQYAVYQIQLDGDHRSGAVQRRVDVESCLAQEPAFHATGLGGLSVECSKGGDCYAMLLNIAGTHVLRCPLQNAQRHDSASPRDGDVHPDSRRGTIVQLADTWGALAVPSFQHGSARYWWGIPANNAASPSALVRLRVRQDAHGASKAFPARRDSGHHSREGSMSAADKIRLLSSPGDTSWTSLLARSIHAFGRSALLGISLDGQLLHAWEAEKLLPLGRWSLPKSHQWLASCAVPGGVFAVGTRGGGVLPAPEVWRFELPQVLQELVKT